MVSLFRLSFRMTGVYSPQSRPPPRPPGRIIGAAMSARISPASCHQRVLAVPVAFFYDERQMRSRVHDIQVVGGPEAYSMQTQS